MTFNVPAAEPAFAETKFGPPFNVRFPPFPSFKESVNVIPVKVTPPVFLTVIV